MARKGSDETRRQRELAQQKAARKERRKAGGKPIPRYEASTEFVTTGLPSDVAQHVRSDLPLAGVWATEGWQEERSAGIVIARREPGGRVVAGGFLLDFGGFGLRDAWGQASTTEADLARRLKDRGYVPIDYGEARRLVLAAVEWAGRWGFALPGEWRVLQNLIEPRQPGEELPMDRFGEEDGRPLLVGEMSDLARRVGGREKVGEYHYIGEVPADELQQAVAEGKIRLEPPAEDA